uniref:Uncharacterized protein n=1 Tax=Nelumbo nucifera TaxID=4432 RepID=A0A822XM75_NELNU|nr:TPA_asm: hypothetical protein HUJ06_022595 [Nelumbo nucifera]
MPYGNVLKSLEWRERKPGSNFLRPSSSLLLSSSLILYNMTEWRLRIRRGEIGWLV